MDSALHYFNDLRLITEASITKTQAGLAGLDGGGCGGEGVVGFRTVSDCLCQMIEMWYWQTVIGFIQTSLARRWAGHCKS